VSFITAAVRVTFTLEKNMKAQKEGRDVGGWSTPRSGRFTPSKFPLLIVQEAGSTSTASLDGCGKSRSHQDSIPGLSSL